MTRINYVLSIKQKLFRKLSFESRFYVSKELTVCPRFDRVTKKESYTDCYLNMRCLAYLFSFCGSVPFEDSLDVNKTISTAEYFYSVSSAP